MKRFFPLWINKTSAPQLLSAACLLAAILASSCVSQAKPQDSDLPEAELVSEASENEAGIATSLPPEDVDIAEASTPRLAWPDGFTPKLDGLPEPELGSGVASSGSSLEGQLPQAGTAAIDVTVLSPLDFSIPLALPDPEPVLPAAAAAPAAAPLPPSPPASVSPVKPTTALVPPAPAPAVPSDPPPATVPPMSGQAQQAPAASQVPAAQPEQFSLPSPPPSSIRPVSPVEAPVVMIEVEAIRNQRFDIRFRGAGWAYLGDEDGKEGIRFETRRFENNDVYFTLNPAQEGDYLLRFRRQNPLNQQMESSLVRVRVIAPAPTAAARRLDNQAGIDIAVAPAGQLASVVPSTVAPASGGPSASGPASGGSASGTSAPAAAVAPPSAAAVSPAAASAPAAAVAGVAGPASSGVGTSPATSGSTAASSGMPDTVAAAPVPSPVAGSASPVAGSTSPVAGSASAESASAAAGSPGLAASDPLVIVPPGRPDANPTALLAWARNELSAGRVQAALGGLDRYVQLYVSGNDELYYLYGLAYEQDTPFRNIKLAHENYKRVRDEYPRSPYRRQAMERIAWMERHFFGLR